MIRDIFSKEDVFIAFVEFDEEVKRWCAFSDDIPGLVLETGTFEEMESEMKEIAPILMEENLGKFADNMIICVKSKDEKINNYKIRIKTG